MSPLAKEVAAAVLATLRQYPAPVTPVYLTPEQASVYLQVPVTTLREWRTERSRDTGPAYMKAGHSVRYRVADLEAWAAAHRVEG